jgi:hypothetical protein
MGNVISETVKQDPACYRALQGWPQSKISSVSHEFKESGAGFILDADDIVNLAQIQKEDSIQVCKVLSRNVRKDSVNVMTLLTAICLLGEGTDVEKVETLGKLFKLDKDPDSVLSLQETAVLIYATSKAFCGVLGVGDSSLDLRNARTLATEVSLFTRCLL